MTRSRPRTLEVAGAMLLVEALAATAFAVAVALSTQSARLVVGVGAALLLFLYAVLLVAVGRGLFRLRRWSRAPTVATQLIQLPVAWSFRGDPTTWVTVLLAVLSVTALATVLAPASTVALEPADPEQ